MSLSKCQLLVQANSISKVLGLEPLNEVLRKSDVAAWIDWWQASHEMAMCMAPEDVEREKAQRKWPPITARMIAEVPPSVARRKVSDG